MRLGLGQRLCCCETCGGCNLDEVTVDIADFTNGIYCTACGDWDGTYILPRSGSSEPKCDFRYVLPSALCLSSFNQIIVELRWDGTNTTIYVRVDFNASLNASVAFERTFSGKVCSGSWEIPLKGEIGLDVCNYDSATVTVTL